MSKYLTKSVFAHEEKKWRKCLGPGGDKCEGQMFTTKYERICPYCKNKIEYMRSGTQLSSSFEIIHRETRFEPCFS